MDENKSTVVMPEKQGSGLEGTENIVEFKSLGERLGPLLAIAMQCCLIYTLLLVASGFFAGLPGPLLPIWAVFLVFFALYWFANVLRRSVKQGTIAHLPPSLRRVLVSAVMGCAVLVCLVFCVWLRFYAPTFSPVDPAWLWALNNDFGQVDRDLQILLLGGLLSVLAWLSYRTVGEQSNAALLLSKGSPLMAILTCISLGEGLLRSSVDFWQTLLLLPVFFWLGLTAQSLQKASAKRRYHSTGLVEYVRYQERIIFQTMSILGLAVVIAAFVMLLIHGDLALHIPRVNPFRMLSIEPVNPPKRPAPTYYGGPINLPHIAIPLVQSEAALGVVISGIVGIFILMVLCTSLYLWLRYRKKKARHKKRERDERKSLWKWSLFLAQCKALLFSLIAFLRLLRRKPQTEANEQSNDILLASSEVRTVRQVYQAFLQRAKLRGYHREKDETPYEFRRRLLKQEPLLEPELEIITEAYALARYGGSLLHVDDLTRVQASWSVLECKWPVEVKAPL